MFSLSAGCARVGAAVGRVAGRRGGACSATGSIYGMSARQRRMASSAAAAAAAEAPRSRALPESAAAVVVGGGIMGCSTAYHLTRAGVDGVHLLEQSQLTAGTTWHAAGLMVTYGSASETSTRIRQYSRRLYQELEEETGQSTGFKPVGFIELASTPDRLTEFRRVAALNRYYGVDVHEIAPQEVQRLFPLCNVDDVLAGFYVPDDGRVNPVDVTMALAKGARQRGVTIHENTGVRAVVVGATGRVEGVVTEDMREIRTDTVVNTCGMWARHLPVVRSWEEARAATLPRYALSSSLANQAAEHYYLITDDIPEVDAAWPVIEDPASYTYIRPEGGGLMVGMFEPVAAAWNVDRIPSSFAFGEIEPDWERMAPFLEKAMARVPRTLEVGAKKLFCGPESFTPDLQPIVGESPLADGLFIGAGMNSIGILTGGGMGKLLATWITEGQPDHDVTAFSADRMLPFQCTREYRAQRVVESLGLVYKCHYPYWSPSSARGAKRMPLHEQHKARGACFGDVSGWEAPRWYADEAAGEQATCEPYTWGIPHWFERWRREHEAVRQRVGVFDMSFMSKFVVSGRDAVQQLNRLCTRDIAASRDEIVYTQWLNEAGKVEADVTVLPVGEGEARMVIATDTMHGHVQHWMRKQFDRSAHVHVTDATAGYAMLSLQGPRAREVLQRATECDMSNDAWPFLCSAPLDIGFARVTCSRISYVGELGFELVVPGEQTAHVHERLCEAGADAGLAHVGLSALGSLRMEKGYRDYGHDVDNTDTLLEVGLGFTADHGDDPSVDTFLGERAVRRERASVKNSEALRRLALIKLEEPERLLYGGEVVFEGDEMIGYVRAASYGHTVGGAVGLAMLEPRGKRVTAAYCRKGAFSVDVAGERVPASASLRPLHDPENGFTKA